MHLQILFILKNYLTNSDESKIIDSAKIDKDGNYKLSGVDSQQNLYMLSFKNNPAVILVNDADKINIDFDLKGFHYPDVNGSEATKELYAFIKDFWQKDSILSDSYYRLDSIKAGNKRFCIYYATAATVHKTTKCFG